MLLRYFKKPLLTMEGSIVHDNYRIFWDFRKQLFLKPSFKKFAIHCPIVQKRRYYLIPHLASNNTRPLKFTSWNNFMYLFPTESPGVFPVVVAVKAGFININPLIFGNILYFLFILRDLLGILLFVMFRLFFRVILRRLSA